MESHRKKVVIVGGGFGGMNTARSLQEHSHGMCEITIIDQKNHHLFQPLLYQVAMAGLSPAEIAFPIRSMFSSQKNIKTLLGNVNHVDLARRHVAGDFGEEYFDYLVPACGAKHSYFQNPEWEEFAPGLKSVEQTTEIRRRVLTCFELAERELDETKRLNLITFVIVGAGPTGVELAGSLGELTRFTLTNEFQNIDPKKTKIILVEAGPRILPMFGETLSKRAEKDLLALGVEVYKNTKVSQILDSKVIFEDGRSVLSGAVLWAAGVKPSELNHALPGEKDRSGRIMVQPDLSLPGHSEIFVIGDQAHVKDASNNPLPGLAPVAIQQGKYIGRMIADEIAGGKTTERKPFRYLDKGMMATIGRKSAIVEIGRLKFTGLFAWLLWLVVHIYFLIGLKNRFFVFLQWAYSYVTFKRGARLITTKNWKMYSGQEKS